VANNINDVEEFGDLPQKQLGKLGQILSKQRLITSRTLDLFLRPDLAKLELFDCGSK
jgi:DNA repair protein RAD7